MRIDDKRLSSNDIIILGLVNESKEPITGQDLERVIEERNMRVWTKIAKSSVYHVLKKLERTKLLYAEKQTIERQGATPPITKMFYTITEEGKQQLRQAILHTLRTREKLVDPFDAALSSALFLPNFELIEVLEARLKVIENSIQALTKQVKDFNQPNATRLSIEGSPVRDHLHIVRALFSRPLTFLLCEKKWIESFLEELKTAK